MGRRLALLIGNSEYNDGHYRKLPGPAQNIQDLERILQDPEHGDFTVTTRINATRTDAERQIHALCKNKVQDDCLLFYFSGHGLKDSDDALYFAMQDTEYDEIEVTSVAASFVKNCIDKCNAEHVIVILDCCYSGAFADILSGYGRVVLTSTDAIQYAWDRQDGSEASHNSVFTHYLVEGMATGEADENNDGEISIEEAFAYVYARTIRVSPNQTPTKKMHQSAEHLVLAKNPSLNNLSKELIAQMEHPQYAIRIGATFLLEELLYLYDGGQKPILLGKVQAALKQLAHDPNKQVARRASEVLETYLHRNTVISNNIRRFTIFLSAPEDISEEKNIVQQVVEKLNADNALRGHAQLTLVTWDKPDTYLALMKQGDEQRRLIKKEILPPSECDIVVMLLWSQMGTSLTVDVAKKDGTRYESSTEWEFEDALRGARRNNGRPMLLLYRNNQPVLRRFDHDKREKIARFRKVHQFLSSLSNPESSVQGGYRRYDDLNQFTILLERNLRAALRKLVTQVPAQQQSELEAPAEMASSHEVQEVIVPYLNWMLEQHSQLALRGLGGDTRLPTIPLEKVYVALKGNRAGTYEREQSRELLDAEATDIIEENGVELSAEHLSLLLYYAERKAIILNPYMPSLMSRDRPEEASETSEEKILPVTLGEAFQKERWMVILGDPGSGKTTLARWIVLKLATAWLRGEPSVVVPAYQVDPRIAKTDTNSVDMGPARLPVLLRVSEFFEAYQKARKNLEPLSIADFLGKHTWLGHAPNVPPDKLQAAIKYYLTQGRVVVILDGMDEITATSQRDDVVRAIEIFIEKWVNARGNEVSPQEKGFLWNPKVLGEPAEKGGNQIIITSRIAGYHAKPLSGHVAHVTIQPMEQVAVEHFCDAWTLATHQLMNALAGPAAIQQEAEAEAEALKKAIFDPIRPRIRELASNPLLVTILALVFRNNQGRLPEQRAGLYQRAMEILIEAWRATGVTTLELIYVLSPLAARIHQAYATGLIEESEMLEIITKELARFRDYNIEDLPPAFELAVDDFVRRIREDVGILSERSEHLFGFLHLTFQEYLAALFLIRNKNQAAQAMANKLDDPRWREPIMMALGHISTNPKWGPEARRHLLITLLDADDPLRELIPRSALLIASAIPEMARIPEDIVNEIIHRLMTTYANRDGIGQFASLRSHISGSLKSIYASKNHDQLEHFLVDALQAIGKPEGNARNMALAAASLIAENKWYSRPLMRALVKAFPYDEESWNYPITRTLQEMSTLSPEIALPPFKPEMSAEECSDLQKQEQIIADIKTGKTETDLSERGEEAAEELALLRSGDLLSLAEAEKQRLIDAYQERLATYHNAMIDYGEIIYKELPYFQVESDILPFRKALENEADLLTTIENDLTWLRLVILLYGGISDYNMTFFVKQYKEIETIFTIDSKERMRYIRQMRKQPYWQEAWDTDNNTIYRLAVFMDTEGGKVVNTAQKFYPSFSPLAIFNDSPLTPLLLGALRQKRSPFQLKERLWQEWRTGGDEVARAHALVALILLDPTSALNALAQSAQHPSTQMLAELVLNHLQLRKLTLADTLVLLGTKDDIFAALNPVDVKYPDEWSDLVELFYRTFTSVMPQPVRYGKELLKDIEKIPYINAEIWAYWLSGLGGDDPVYSLAVVLDTLGKRLHAAPALINLYQAHNRKYNEFATWYVLALPPAFPDETDEIGEALTIIQHSKSEKLESLFYRAAISFSLANAADHPGLLEDALATALLIPQKYQPAVIADLDAELAKKPAYEAEIITRILAIPDAVIRARALWRLLYYIRVWNGTDLLPLAIEAAEALSEPLQRERAFERLFGLVSLKRQEKLKTIALEAARQISDPDNRARALGRLALYESDNRHWQYLTEALAACEKITDERQKTECLLLLSPYLAENTQLRKIHAGFLNQLTSKWHWFKGHRLLSFLLLDRQDQLSNPSAFTPVVLSTLIDDVAMLKLPGFDLDDLWSRLLEPEQREQATIALFKRVATLGLEGSIVSSLALEVIKKLLVSGEISVLYGLFPYMRITESAFISVLNEWLEEVADPMMHTYAGLWLAEMGQVNASTIPCLLELFKHGVDIASYRARLVLHGSQIYVQKVNRDYRSSQLGLDALMLLVRLEDELRDEKAYLSDTLGDMWCNITHDDPQLFQQLVDHFADQKKGGNILSTVSYCDNATLEVLVTQLEQGTENIQRSLISSWELLNLYHFRKRITNEQINRVENAIKNFSPQLFESTEFILERHPTLASILGQVSEQLTSGKIKLQEVLAVLNQTVNARISSLATISIEDIATDTGEYYTYADAPRYALEAGEAISANSSAQELLFLWLAACLRENINDERTWHNLLTTLLEIAAATTQFSPAATFNLIEKYELGPLLIEASLYHRKFFGRAAAASLLGYLRQTPAKFAEALLGGLQDNAKVQTAIMQAVQNLRYLDERRLPDILELLKHESASVVYATARLLVSIARHGNLSLESRQEIVKRLSAIIQQKNAMRPVFVFEEANAYNYIRLLGQLDQQLYAAIVDITGVL